MDNLLESMKNLETGFGEKQYKNKLVNGDFEGAPDLFSFLMTTNSPSMNHQPDSVEIGHSTLPWRDRKTPVVCHGGNGSEDTSSRLSEFESQTTCFQRSIWRNGDEQPPAADRQVSKLNSAYSEAEYSWHHQEHDYAHHAHCLRHHHHFTGYFIDDHTNSAMLWEENPDQLGVNNETALSKLTHLTDTEPHFRENYPHHHHHSNYHQARFGQLALCNSEHVPEYSLDLQSQNKLNELENFGMTNDIPSEANFKGAWHKLESRILNWLNDVQNGTGVMDEHGERDMHAS